ncbi:MAG: 16S rRNA (cytidine(1402)-2'-O)-methyltransferase [Candidatus Beckwithbacteria bacterium]|nr:16S rRNA (cytidine(1402)-2'-O)-methyltransferase [Patescibacteria group bacterium]
MGTLYVVSTPIGNMKDITLRAIEVLKETKIILSEDTRKTGMLLKRFEIENKKLVSYFEANEEQKIGQVIDWLKQGYDVALVSSAGTPLVSDPGFKLVRECAKENLKVVPIPGASAILAGLVVAGLPTDKFVFLGFLPKKSGKKEKLLVKTLETNMTVVFYESPFRILKTLKMLNHYHSGVVMRVVIGRELTKKFEEVMRGTPDELINKIGDKKVKGELVVLVKLIS